MPKALHRNLAGVAALFTLLWVILLGWVIQKYPFDHNFPMEIDSPVLALELSENQTDIEAVLHRQQKGTFSKTKDAEEKEAIAIECRANQLDLVFIPLYVLAIVSFGSLFAAKVRLLTAAAVSAGLFDYLEDWKIFEALSGGNSPIYVVSLIKWGLLGLVFVWLALILFRSQSQLYSLSTKRIFGIGYLVAGLLLLIDVAFVGTIGYHLIELALELVGLLLVGNVVGLLGRCIWPLGIRQRYIDNFCEQREELEAQSRTAVEGEPLA